MRVDSVTFEVVDNALVGIAGQMAFTIRHNMMISTGD